MSFIHWRTSRIACLAGIAFIGLLAAQTSAAVMYSNPAGSLRDDFTGSTGARFQVSQNLTVTHLGYFDDDNDGNAVAHQVGLWTGPGGSTTLLGSVTVQAGTASALTSGFRYESLSTPINLIPGVDYWLGGEVITGSGDFWPNQGTMTLDSNFTVIWSSYRGSSIFPPPVDFADGSGTIMFGAPNLMYVVPEPAALSLVAFCAMGLLARRRA